MPCECGVTCSTSACCQVGDGFDSSPNTWSKLKMLEMVPAAAMTGALQNRVWCLDPKTDVTYNQANLGHSNKGRAINEMVVFRKTNTKKSYTL